MRILHIAPYLAPIYGGVTRSVESLIPALGKEGVTVDLISTVAAGPGVLPVPVDKWMEVENHRRKYFSCSHRNDLVWSASLLKWVVTCGREYDLIHAHTLFSPLISSVATLARARGIPYVMTPHGMLDPWALQYKGNRKRPYWFLWERGLMRNAVFVHGLHSEEENQLRRQGVETEVVVASNGIPEESDPAVGRPEILFEHFPGLRGKRLILFLSRIDPKKGIDLLIPAFVKVQVKFPDAHLVLAGPDTIGYREKLEPLLPSQGVHFLGMLEGDLKRAAFAAADCFILPSYSEGFSMAILEALTAGLPTLLSAECHFPEAVSAEMAREVPLEISGIAAGLERILGDPEESRRMGENASKWVREHYTWRAAAQKLIRGYSRAVRGC